MIALGTIGLVAEGYAKRLCPVDTGRLRGSITHTQMDEDTEVIGTNVEYAPYVELGTTRTRAQPYLRPAISDHVDQYARIIKKVMKD
jgi:HK97 gp10 family phage protein